MAEDAIKKRMARAKNRAEADLRALGYDVVISNNRPVCLVASRGSDVRFIRVCLDSYSVSDKISLSRFRASSVVTRELWIRRSRDERFEIHKI